ncbi:MAG: GAP family protein [Galbitalea sp.]
MSTVVLLLAGAHEVAAGSVTAAARWIGYAVLAIGALAPILVPLVWFVVRPRAAGRQLDRLNRFITRHGRTLGVLVCLITGFYLLARGFRLV